MISNQTPEVYIKQNGDVYEIKFMYDPDLVELIKTVPGRQWMPNQKMWILPKDRLGFLLKAFQGTRYELHTHILSEEQLNQNASIDVTTVIPDTDISDYRFRVKPDGKLLSHQLDFLKFAVHRQQQGNFNGFLVADEPGLGKTLEAANLAIYNREHHKFKHCLIVCCINSSKLNWLADIALHTQSEYVPYILGTRIKRNGEFRYTGSGAEKYEDIISRKMYGRCSGQPLPYFIILNVEALRYKKDRSYAITDAIIDMIWRGQLQMIVIDEVHKNASPSSQQGKQLLRIKKSIENRVLWLPMTGTPITNSPTDLYTPLKLTNSCLTSSYYKWCQEYCMYGGFGGHDIVGYKNIPKLKVILQHNMIRRLKSMVLDLPEKIEHIEYVENTPYQSQLYENVLSDIWSHKDEIVSSLNPMTRLLRLRQVNGSPELIDDDLSPDDSDYLMKNARLSRVLEIIDEINANGEKVLIFSNWVEPLRTLYKYVSKKYKTCCYTGTMSFADREHHKHVFMTNPEYTVMIGTIGAMGTTHTLTAANNVIFYDCPWTPSDKEQAIDRTHRVGAHKTINIYTLVTKDTIDERVQDILYTKKGISEFIVDGSLDIYNNPKLFDFLLGDQIKGKKGNI